MMTKFYIYKIFFTEDPNNILYIGSTNNMSRRKSQHKKNTTNKRSKHYNQSIYQYMRLCGGFDKFTIEQIEELEYTNKPDRFKKEQEYIDLYKSKLNINKAIFKHC